MCYDSDARPPYPPISGGAADGQDIVLTAPDGNQFAAYIAYAAQPTGPQVVIYPDVRGLHQFYKELALRFAEVGVRALAIDYFGRTAGLTPRDESFEYMPHVEQMTIPTFLTDVMGALAYLRGLSKADRPTFIVGFCRGGTLALHTGAEEFNLAGLDSFLCRIEPSHPRQQRQHTGAGRQDSLSRARPVWRSRSRHSRQRHRTAGSAGSILPE